MIIITNNKDIIKAINKVQNAIGADDIQVIDQESSDQDYDLALKTSLADAREKSIDKGIFDGCVKRYLKILTSMSCKEVENIINDAERAGNINILRCTSMSRRFRMYELRAQLQDMLNALRAMLGDFNVEAVAAVLGVLNARYVHGDNILNHHEFTFLDNKDGILKYFSCCIRCQNASIAGKILFLLPRYHMVTLDAYNAIFTLNNSNILDFIKLSVDRHHTIDASNKSNKNTYLYKILKPIGI